MTLKGPKSITAQITFLFAAASTAVLLLLGILIGKSVERHFQEQDMRLLKGKLELTAHALEKVYFLRDLDAIPQQLDDALVGHPGLAVVVLAPDGQTIFATNGADFPQILLDSRDRAPAMHPLVWKTKGGQPFRGISSAVPIGIKDSPPAVVAVATDISHHNHFMGSFQATLWSVVVFAAILTGFLGWGAVRRGLAPLRAINQGAAGITANRLHHRMSSDFVPVELAELVETLDAMLARLEDSFRRLSDFSSDLAHELRTPVSNLLTQTQVTLSQIRTVDDYQDILASNAEEFERLSRIIADMLFLAKSDNNLIIPNQEVVNLADEVQGLTEFYEVLVEEKGIALTTSGSASVLGDRLMLRRAISNLLSNAIRHTPQGGQIVVHIDNTAGEKVTLSVENTGPSIPAEHLPRLFDRFYRVDASRHRCSEGAGLGLAITQSILNAHGGSTRVSSKDGYTRFDLGFPAQHAA